MKKVNIQEAFENINDYWSPKIGAELNGQHLKLAKLKGEFVWHKHDNEDEMFLVVEGQLQIEFKDKTEVLNAGEYLVIPKGIEHKPIAIEEVKVLLFEPATTINTGNTTSDLKKENLDWI
ncbi:MAG: cupin domain-containing protein [Salibacteraceae bacterium]